MGEWQQRIRSAFEREGVSLDLDVLEELALHAEATYDARIAAGEAESEALAHIDRLIEGWRREPQALNRIIKRAPAVAPPVRPSSFAGAVADAIYGVRLLRARPGYAAVTILTIALGVGAVTTLFSVTQSVLLRPLSWAKSDRIVRVIESRGGRQGRIARTIMNGSYLAWSESPQTIDGIGSWTDGALTLTGSGDAVRVTVTNVSPSLFDVLDAEPLRGRLFTPAEGSGGNWHYVVLSQGIWEQRFGAREDIIGQSIVLDGSPCEVVGIMPRSFVFPTRATQLWLPMTVSAVDGPNGVKRGQIFRALARLKPGVTVQQAAAEATARAAAAPDAGQVASALFGAKTPIQMAVVDANDAATDDVRPAIVILLIASALLFATAIANVANMQLARAMARHRELTIRAALGAGTARISRQLLIENAIVGAIGATFGLALAISLHRVMPSLLPAGFPRADEITIDARVLLFAALLAIVTTIAAGVFPLLQVRRLELARALASDSLASAGAGRGRAAITRLVIVASQVAVTSILLIGAAVLTRSFIARLEADRGYDASHVVTATVPFPADYSFEQRQQARARILARLKRPGITHAAFSTGVPLVSAGGFVSFNFPSPVRDGVEVQAESIRRLVTPDYFGALGVRVRAGRPLTDGDGPGTPTAVVVNRSFVREYLDDIPVERAIGLPLGTYAVRGTSFNGPATIVGVADDLRQDAVEAPQQAEMFVAIAQVTEPQQGQAAIVIVRTAGDPAAYVETLRSVVRDEDPRIALDGVMTLEQRVGESISKPRTYALLLVGFATFALLIGGAGLFGVLSQSVSQRSRELAVRAALGAGRTAVIAVALKQMSIAIAAGLIIGLAASAGLSNTLAPFIYGVSTRDALSFIVAPIAVMIVGVIACIVPARRVANANPIQVLREG
jgi:putative ABC transport system permease protein